MGPSHSAKSPAPRRRRGEDAMAQRARWSRRRRETGEHEAAGQAEDGQPAPAAGADASDASEAPTEAFRVRRWPIPRAPSRPVDDRDRGRAPRAASRDRADGGARASRDRNRSPSSAPTSSAGCRRSRTASGTSMHELEELKQAEAGPAARARAALRPERRAGEADADRRGRAGGAATRPGRGSSQIEEETKRRGRAPRPQHPRGRDAAARRQARRARRRRGWSSCPATR